VSPRRRLALIAIAVVAFDQITKAVALAALDARGSVRAIDGIMYWTLQRNPGAAFGIFRRAPVLFTVLAIVISAAIIGFSSRVRDGLSGVALGLVLGGALGNLGDRLFRPPGPFRGRVIDFIDFRVWPTFNVADVAVVVGAALLALASFRDDRARAAPDESGT
jgi:signal peptidase II